MRRFGMIAAVVALASGLILQARADEFDLTWFTIDGGGDMHSSGGSFELSGTIGQPDAGLMIGGGFELSGGFWAGAVLVCLCPGDMNGDSLLDARDIQRFVECLTLPSPTGCNCADVDRAGGVSLDDVEHFVSDLLDGTTCSTLILN